jgi:hypothetical protein
VNLAETSRLCRLIEQISPAQKFNEETPAAWFVLLEEVTLADALEAAKALAKRQPYIAPADLVNESRRIRTHRLDDVGVPTPNVDPDDAGAFAEELRALTAAVASGQMDRAGRARYDAGGVTLTGAAPKYALGSEMKSRPAIAAAFGSVFRDARGQRRPSAGRPVRALAEREDEAHDTLAAARARLDAEAQS